MRWSSANLSLRTPVTCHDTSRLRPVLPDSNDPVDGDRNAYVLAQCDVKRDDDNYSVRQVVVEVRNTGGTLLATPATYSNLNKGTAGVYSQKSLNLSAYKGQTVRVQFRSTTDSSLATTFRVDDASLR